MGGRAAGSRGVAPPSPPPSSGTRRHLHTFRLARCSPFRPPRFQLLIWKRKKKPAGRGRQQGGNWSRSAARAPPASGAGCRRRSAPPRDSPGPRPPPRPAPSSMSLPLLTRRGQPRGPLSGKGQRPCWGRSPPGALLPRNVSLSPRNPAWCTPPLRPEVNPSLSATPQLGVHRGQTPASRLPH